MSEDWYDRIEPAVRPVVELLRNSGFNTTCSCGHVRYVEMESYEEGDAERLLILLMENGYDNFWIEMRISRMPGQLVRRSMRVELGRPPD